MSVPNLPKALPLHHHVHHILIAEFDIDKGSQISHQFPSATGADESVLAEAMLPEGVHNREEDWTVFFLNQSASETDGTKTHKPIVAKKEGPSIPTLEALIYQFLEDTGEWSLFSEEARKIYLEPNAIRFSTANGDPIIISRDAELQHKSMEPLYHCVIGADGAFGFRFLEPESEEKFQSHCEQLRDPTLIPEPNEVISPQPLSQDSKMSDVEAKPVLYCLNLVRNKRVEGVRRGAVVKAIAISSPYRWVHVYKPLLLLALDRYFKTPEVSILSELFDAVNAMDISGMPELSQTQKLMLRSSGDKDKQIFTTSVPYMKINIPMRIPLTSLDDEVADSSVIQLISIFGPGIMILYNALLFEKRIIFVGYGKPAKEVVNHVLAAMQLVCPPLSGLLKRCFPYTSLANLKFLEFRGYLVGVTNPVFRDNTDWWDCLCNIETGKVTANPKYFSISESERYMSQDNEFIADVMAKIEAHYGEDYIRQMFTDYTQRLVDLGMNDAEFPDDSAKRKELETNHSRIEQWRRTVACLQYSKERQARRDKLTIVSIDVAGHIAKLRIRRSLSAQEIYSIFKDFNTHINTDQQLLELLSYLPENQGGIYPIALSLMHPSENVRRATAELFHRLSRIDTGREMINSLNVFLKTAYERSKALIAANRGEK